MSEQRFIARVIKSGTGAHIVIPFDPDEVWGPKDRHHVAGSIDGRRMRACLDTEGTPCILSLGPAWLRDNPIDAGAEVEVVLDREGHHADNVAADIGDALCAEPQARHFFESMPPFYRNNYIRWIEEAKRPETRSARIVEMVKLLKEGVRRQ